MGARKYSAEFKEAAVKRMAGCTNMTRLAAELGIRRKFLYLWRDQLAGASRPGYAGTSGLPAANRKAKTSGADAEARARAADKARIAELERQLGRKQLEIDFFRQAFEHVREATERNTSDGGKPSIKPSAVRDRSKQD